MVPGEGHEPDPVRPAAGNVPAKRYQDDMPAESVPRARGVPAPDVECMPQARPARAAGGVPAMCRVMAAIR